MRFLKYGLGLLLLLILMECGVRYYWYGANGFSQSKLRSNGSLRATGFLQRAQNDSILWELKPNLNTFFRLSQFTTNSFGMRGREYTLKKPLNTKRIAVIGDSFALGSGVSDSENYPALLETLLSQQSKETHVEVLNFSVGNYGFHNYTAVLNEKVIPFEPDIVIIGFNGRDGFLLPNKQHLEGKYEFPPAANLFYHPYLYSMFSLSNRKKKLLNRKATRVPSNDQVTLLNQYFHAIASRCKSAEIPVLIAHYAMPVKSDATNTLESLALSHNMHFLNATASLENVPLEDQFVHQLDAHPNAMVHKVYTQNIFEYLINNQLISP